MKCRATTFGIWKNARVREETILDIPEGEPVPWWLEPVDVGLPVIAAPPPGKKRKKRGRPRLHKEK